MPLVEVRTIQERGAVAQRGGGGVAAGGRDQDLLADHGRSQHELRAGLARLGHAHGGGGQRGEPGHLRRDHVVARGQGHAETSVGATDHGAGARVAAHGEHDLRDGRALAGAHLADQVAGAGGRGEDQRRRQQERGEEDAAHHESPDPGARREGRGMTPQLLHARSLRTIGPGQVSWLPGRHPTSAPSPVFPSGVRDDAQRMRSGSPATVAGPRRRSTCFPFPPPHEGHPGVCRSLTAARAGCQCPPGPWVCDMVVGGG